MKKKPEAGDTVRVKSKQGDVVVEITGRDPQTGLYTGVAKSGKIDGGSDYHKVNGEQMYVAPGQIRRV